MDKKRIIMIVMMVAAAVLLALKLGPIFMPRSWRAKRMARELGQTAPAKKREQPAPASQPAPEPQPAAVVQTVEDNFQPDSPVEISPELLDGAIEEIRAMMVSGRADASSPVEGMDAPFGKPVAVRESDENQKPHISILVSGILYDSQRPLAIINGRIYAESDEFEGIVVYKIGRDSVVLRYEETKFNIPVGEKIGG